MEGGSGYDCDDEDGCEASGDDRGESLVRAHTHTHTSLVCFNAAGWVIFSWQIFRPGLEGESVLHNRFPPSFSSYLPCSLSTFLLVSLVSAGSLLLLLSAMIKDALTSMLPQKEKSKNNQLLFIYLFFTYSSCLCFHKYIMTITGWTQKPWETPQTECSNVL